MNNFVFPEELTYFVESLRPFAVADVGSSKWLDTHELIIKLGQQALLEAGEHREEAVKECLILRDKLRVLIHESFCVDLWKTRVLPHLLEIDPNPHATFLIYTVLFHEGTCVSLLDAVLFHGSGCEALLDSAIDLVDYCAQSVAQLIGLVNMGHHENDSKVDVDEAILSELERQKRELIYKIGLRCISILSSLADNANVLPIGAIRRMVVTHDIPWLMADLLHFRPWQRRAAQGMQKFIDEKWTYVKGDVAMKVVKHEAQTWFCLRQLLLNNTIMESYEINEERRKHLAKCQGLLHDVILDQLPPLIDLKEQLCRLSVASSGGSNTSKKSNLLLEEVPEIRENLIKEAYDAGGFFAIAQLQEPIFLHNDRDKTMETAKRLNAAYNTDLLVELEEQITNEVEATKKAEEKLESVDAETNNKQCGNCSGIAEKKCSNCKSIYYCSRKCQLLDWPKHKQNCINVD